MCFYFGVNINRLRVNVKCTCVKRACFYNLVLVFLNVVIFQESQTEGVWGSCSLPASPISPVLFVYPSHSEPLSCIELVCLKSLFPEKEFFPRRSLHPSWR